MVSDTNSAPAASAHASRPVRFRIKRQDNPGAAPRWEEFVVDAEPGANVIACLQQIARMSKTAEGSATTPVCYDSGCLEEVCGSCAMVINGRVRPSCSALVDNVIGADGTITLEPLSKFPVVRDLAVDRSRAFEALKRVKAWVPVDGTYHLGAGPKDTPENQEMRYTLSTCMTCACCLEACPQFNLEEDATKWESEFVGPHAISQARLFNTHPTGATLAGERLDVLMAKGGVNDCGNAQNCVKVCPKEIPLTESIAAIGRAVTVHGLKRFFSGR
ncbi:MAG: succinate dehydrogenase iron-sulfur subunit [Phycisphaerales bacterium]